MTLLLTACAVPHEYTIPPGQKFIDGEVRYGYLRVQTRPADNEPPEITLFQDGQGNDFTIYER
jgi:hypothetical protein